MADEVVDELHEADEPDEPQFKVETKVTHKKSKSSSVKGTIVLLIAIAAAITAVVFLDDIMSLGSKTPNVRVASSLTPIEPEQTNPVLNPQLSEETAQSGTADFVVSSVDETTSVDPFVQQASYSTIDNVSITTQVEPSVQTVQNNAVAGQGLNLVLANRLKDLTLAVDSLSGQVGALKGQLMTVQRELGQQTLNVQRTLDSVGSTLELARKGDENRDQLITRVLGDIRGFQKDIGDERERFTFKILHEEFYGGRARIIGFDERRPQSIIKLYVGDDVGLWRLVGIKNGVAVFQHSDGKEHRENLT